MSILRSIKIWPRLVIAFLFFASLTVAVGAYGIYNLRLANERSVDMYANNVLAVRDLAETQKNLLLHTQTFMHALADASDQKKQSATLQRLEKYWNLSKKKWDAYATTSADNDEILLREAFKKEVSNFLNLKNDAVDQLEHGNVGDAAKMISGPLDNSATKLNALLDKLVQSNLQQAADSNAKNEASARQATNASIALIATAIIGALAVGLVITQSITKPIQGSVETAQQIAQKNLTRAILIEGVDEITDLSRALQIMQEGLRSTLSTISGSSSQLAAASEEMNVVTEDMSRTINASNDQLQMAVAAVTELSASIDDVAHNAEATSSSSESASNTVRKGRTKVSETKSAINNLTVQIEQASSIVGELANKIEQVGSVLGVIGAIADQTNLLALNAAIEAARAGESGRGFSVVADEVRALAARTQTSTHEIANILNSVRQASENAASSMSVSSTMAEDTRKLADEADHTLEQIAEVIVRIKEMNVTVATTTEEQAATAREVDRNIATIKDMSEQNATASLQVNSSSHELARIATELNGMVGAFRV